MKDTEIFKVLRIWLISVGVFDVLFISFLYILGNYTEQNFPTELIPVTIIIALISAIVGVFSIIFSFIKKQPKQVFIGLGILFFAVILFFFSLIIGIATVY